MHHIAALGADQYLTLHHSARRRTHVFYVNLPARLGGGRGGWVFGTAASAKATPSEHQSALEHRNM